MINRLVIVCDMVARMLVGLSTSSKLSKVQTTERFGTYEVLVFNKVKYLNSRVLNRNVFAQRSCLLRSVQHFLGFFNLAKSS